MYSLRWNQTDGNCYCFLMWSQSTPAAPHMLNMLLMVYGISIDRTLSGQADHAGHQRAHEHRGWIQVHERKQCILGGDVRVQCVPVRCVLRACVHIAPFFLQKGAGRAEPLPGAFLLYLGQRYLNNVWLLFFDGLALPHWIWSSVLYFRIFVLRSFLLLPNTGRCFRSHFVSLTAIQQKDNTNHTLTGSNIQSPAGLLQQTVFFSLCYDSFHLKDVAKNKLFS